MYSIHPLFENQFLPISCLDQSLSSVKCFLLVRSLSLFPVPRPRNLLHVCLPEMLVSLTQGNYYIFQNFQVMMAKGWTRQCHMCSPVCCLKSAVSWLSYIRMMMVKQALPVNRQKMPTRVILPPLKYQKLVRKQTFSSHSFFNSTHFLYFQTVFIIFAYFFIRKQLLSGNYMNVSKKRTLAPSIPGFNKVYRQQLESRLGLSSQLVQFFILLLGWLVNGKTGIPHWDKGYVMNRDLTWIWDIKSTGKFATFSYFN